MSQLLAKNLKWLMESNGFKTPTAMAHHLKMPQPTLFRLMLGASREPKISTVEKIAAHFGLPPHQLMETDLSTGEVMPIHQPQAPRREVAMCEWDDAIGHRYMLHNPHGATIPVMHGKPGRHAFALKIQGDSMAPAFPEHDTYIVVDPSRRAESGDYVVYYSQEKHQPALRRLVKDGGSCFLRPSNTDYPTVEVQEKDLIIVGVVTESHTIKKL